jgi:hypothetical protein
MAVGELETRLKSLESRQLQFDAELNSFRSLFTTLEAILHHLNDIMQQKNSPYPIQTPATLGEIILMQNPLKKRWKQVSTHATAWGATLIQD